MKTKRRMKNVAMVVIILLIAAAGLCAAGSVLGWFSGDENAALLRDVRGIVSMWRSGVSYPLEQETALRAGDQIVCDAGATAAIEVDGGVLTLGGNADLTVKDADQNGFSAEVSFGEIFVEAVGETRFSFEGKDIELQNCVALLSVRGGAQTLNMLEGESGGIEAGEKIDWIGRDKSIGMVSVEELDDFALTRIRSANASHRLCVSNDELDVLEQKRSAAIQSQLASGDPDANMCGIAIYCDTILDNWSDLDTAKASFVPEDGVILAPTQVEFEPGETVFDVLTRVCEAYDIQIEYSWTPLYDSYYIEGIHQLYEFDCGSQSGWMYKVNEWFPNYGCSEYKLTGGESIVWCYTCKGLGADVGGPTF